MRGYFGIGVEEISKEYNAGNLVRSAHSFGASFFFTINSEIDLYKLRASDTADSFEHMPYYQFKNVAEMDMPQGCALVGVEFVDESITLPSFRHPMRAAYVLGPEMGSLSPALVKKCDHIIKIPMKFCVNVGTAGAIVMYDRLLSMGKFSARPVKAGGPEPEAEKPVFGTHRRKQRTKKS